MRGGKKGCELENKLIRLADLTEGAEIQGKQSKIILPHGRRQFRADPLDETGPIAAQAKGLRGCLAPHVGLIVPQRSEESESGGNFSSLREGHGPKQFRLRAQGVRRMEKAHEAGEPGRRTETLPAGKLSGFAQTEGGERQ